MISVGINGSCDYYSKHLYYVCCRILCTETKNQLCSLPYTLSQYLFRLMLYNFSWLLTC